MSEKGPFKGYIPNTPSQQEKMLKTIGAGSIDELFVDIPQNIRNPKINLPEPLTEMELMEEMQDFAATNKIMPSFLGAGTYYRFQPAAVRALIMRDEFLTSYTPYQPEISQGTLQVSFEYQTMMCNLYGMEVSNTGMYDGASAMAEAALMAGRLKPERKKIIALDTVHPNWLSVTKAYLGGKELELDVLDIEKASEKLEDAAALVVQTPNFLGNLENLKKLGEMAHEKGALFIVAADPISVGMLKSPGECGADIAVGEGQSLGHPPHLGGINLGIFTSKDEYVRQMPGRIVGKTNDNQGRTGYVLTLQPREQHIKREKATSNICTAEQLIATGATIYLSLLGKEGHRKVAELNYDKAHYLEQQITKIPGFNRAYPDKYFFNEFVVICPKSPKEINKQLLDKGIIGGKDVSDRIPNGMLLCATETTSKKNIDLFVEHLSSMR